MAYNLTNLSGSTNILEVLQNADQIVDGMMSIGILIALLIIIFVMTLREGPLVAFGASTFITSIVGMLFILAGLIETSRLVWFILPLAIVIVMGLIKRQAD